MRPEPGVLGVFSDPARAAAAVRSLRSRGPVEIRAAMPAPFPEVMDAIGAPESRIGVVTFVGGVLGTASGFALSIYTAVAWPMITGGKPIVSIPPFCVIAFELTVLFGAIANLLALLVRAALGRRARGVPPDPRFMADRIGLFVPGAGEVAEGVFRAGGAEEVRRVA